MTGKKEYLRDYRTINAGGYVTFGNNSNGLIKGYGSITNGSFTIKNVAYVEGLKHNLVSVGKLCDTGHRVEFDGHNNYIMPADRSKCFVTSKKRGTMFPLDISLMVGKPQICLLSKAMSEVSWLWHRRLAHLNFRYMNNLVTGEMVRGLP
ncbi:hypothetical protein E9993_23260, partial [Labilibacter sediminis]